MKYESQGKKINTIAHGISAILFEYFVYPHTYRLVKIHYSKINEVMIIRLLRPTASFRLQHQNHKKLLLKVGGGVYSHIKTYGDHILRHMGMCGSNGSHFHKKFFIMGPIFYKNILKHRSLFQKFSSGRTRNFEKGTYISRKVLKNGYLFLSK